ncbi:MAG TPA: GNAT family N-acetyltransferase [Tetragenococcus sp.]|nr:GNAT family N-acetyltransferase [Tetragenococcus sp.]
MYIVEKKNKFVAVSETGKIMGELSYSPAGDKLWIIDHTDVDDLFRGQHVGNKLLEYAVEAARKTERKILPLCPFANRVMSQNRGKYADILFS